MRSPRSSGQARTAHGWLAVALSAALAAACGGSPRDAGSPALAPASPAATPAAAATSPGDLLPLQDLEIAERLRLDRPQGGDLDAIAARRFLRVLVPASRTFYFVNGAQQAGLAYESAQAFEKALAARFEGRVPPRVLIIPTTRERLLGALAEGYGDIAIGGFTITGSRRHRVDFSTPTATAVRDVVVTGPGVPAPRGLADLAGREIHVRPSSSYHEDLVALGDRLEREGRARPRVVALDDSIEDEDVLQMVDAGIVPATVVKATYAAFWAQLYDRVSVHESVALRSDGETAWAVRRDAPRLREAVNEFVAAHRKGTVFGNTLLKRYLGTPARLHNPRAQEDLRRFRAAEPHFRKYGERYRLPWLVVAAQAYQESRLDQDVRSRVGAVGVMQLMPATGRSMQVGDIHRLESNIHAGIKYLRTIVDEHFADAALDPLERALFAFAAYNAGPARVAGLRRAAEAAGYDKNRWFGNVELVAARRVGREPVDYVANIYKYYTVYVALAAQQGPHAEEGR